MARLDTGWHVNPKVLKVGLAGMGLHAWSISYCDHALSDGFIPNGAWPALTGVRAAVMALVRAGLWVPVEDGFRLHDYTDYNRTRAQVAARQAEDRARKQPPESARNPAGNGTESNRIPRAPGPGPGPGPLKTTPYAVEAAAPEHARAHVEPDPQLMAEHLRRVEQERQTAAAAPAHVNFSEETLA